MPIYIDPTARTVKLTADRNAVIKQLAYLREIYPEPLPWSFSYAGDDLRRCQFLELVRRFFDVPFESQSSYEYQHAQTILAFPVTPYLVNKIEYEIQQDGEVAPCGFTFYPRENRWTIEHWVWVEEYRSYPADPGDISELVQHHSIGSIKIR